MLSELPIWLNQGVEPPESLKTTGWQPGMKPSAQHMNWLFNRSYLVMKELQENSGTAELQNELNALKTKVNTHLEDKAQHNQFIHEGKLHQIGFGYNPTLGCMTYSIREVI
ncbi:hypothetical protein FC756_15990 [Lysinibacillus mangiferihumi]|uniref:Uncharacterized protein n=1 Tax=Lysinibacillus mangiferihumi TaxID=1130819 RepID=A0A4U2YWD7_9BACI|nr:hypothetical protein [Lysinibacillus mangiferihumi]TKI65550.1 hypothetical protein FC756_15990 [Lysinibacillus mangiferihumi]